MWSDWLADTLNRSTIDPVSRNTQVPRVPDVHDDAQAADREAVTGLLIHEGFGAEYPHA